MKTFKDFVAETAWDFHYNGHGMNKSVRIDKPGHEAHGKTGVIRRQQGTDYGVEVPGSEKMHWLNANELK